MCRWKWRMNIDAIVRNMGITSQFLPPPPSPVSLPVTFVGGAKSSYLSPENQRNIPLYFSNAEVHMLEGAGKGCGVYIFTCSRLADTSWWCTGHWVHAEQPKEFARLVKSTLARAA